MSVGVTKPMATSWNFDKVCSDAPDGRFRKLFLIRDAKNFDKSPNSIYFKYVQTHWSCTGSSRRLKCTMGCPSSLIFSTSALKTLNGIQQNLTGSKISTSSSKFVFLEAIGKTRWPPRPLIGRYIFDFSSETTERNSTKLDRKQDLNVLYQTCVFSAPEPKAQVHYCDHALSVVVNFSLLLWNRLTKFNETWQ